MKRPSVAVPDVGIDPAQLWKGLQEFSESAQMLSETKNQLMETHPQQWVAVYQGKVVAQASTIDAVMTKVDSKNLPRDSVIVRFIDTEPRTMIL